MLHHAAASAVADIDHRVGHAAAHIHLVQRPGEHGLVERLRLRQVLGVEFDVHECIGHGCPLRVPQRDRTAADGYVQAQR